MRRTLRILCDTSVSKVSHSLPLRGSEELAKLRASVAVTRPTDPEAMTTFKDNRPRPANESTQDLQRRLKYQSRYRGMVEMDIIFGSFAQRKLPELTSDELLQYDNLLRQFDNDLFQWLVMGVAPPPEIAELSTWKKLLSFVQQQRSELLEHQL